MTGSFRNHFALAVLFVALGCATRSGPPKEGESAAVESIGVVVLGADAIQTARNGSAPKSFHLSKATLSSEMAAIVVSELTRRGYTAIRIANPGVLGQSVQDENLNISLWRQPAWIPELKELAHRKTVSHLLVISPENRAYAPDKSASGIWGFAIASVTPRRDNPGGTHAIVSFRADLIDSQGQIVTGTSFQDFHSVTGAFASELVNSRRGVRGLSAGLKNQSIEYFRGTIPKLVVVVPKMGFVAKTVDQKTRLPASN